MTAATPVFTDLLDYRVASSALPLSARVVNQAAGSIVVLDGASPWWEAALDAVAAGASALIVDEPREPVPPAMAGQVAACGVPIIVHRPRLRHDLVSQAIEHRAGLLPRIVVGECRASRDSLLAVVRDAVGWVRALSGSPLSAPARPHASAGTALLRTENGHRVAGSMTITLTRPEGAILRLTALGETVTEVEIDDLMGSCRLETSTRFGRLEAPYLFETGPRVALRRALEAIDGRLRPDDLSELVHDESVARAIVPLGSYPL